MCLANHALREGYKKEKPAATNRIRGQLLKRQTIFGKELVAVANKHAQQIWAMLSRGEDYDRFAALKHPLAGLNKEWAQA